MAYRIDFDNPLGDEVRRIASELLIDAIDRLEKQPDGPHEAIHDARKNIKRIRALYRLVASDAEEFASAENRRLRDLARTLAHLRDRAALADAADFLDRATDLKHAKVATGRLCTAMNHHRDSALSQQEDIRETLSICCEGLRDAESALHGLDLPKLRKQAIQCLASGWQKVGKKARNALAACEEATDEEPFHDLRKRAQDRFMHAALLNSIWPSGMISIQRQAKVLVDILGHEHDLVMLNDAVPTQKETKPVEREILSRAIAAERAKLQAAARELGRDIFGGKPKRDAAIVASLIRNRG